VARGPGGRAGGLGEGRAAGDEVRAGDEERRRAREHHLDFVPDPRERLAHVVQGVEGEGDGAGDDGVAARGGRAAPAQASPPAAHPWAMGVLVAGQGLAATGSPFESGWVSGRALCGAPRAIVPVKGVHRRTIASIT